MHPKNALTFFFNYKTVNKCTTIRVKAAQD